LSRAAAAFVWISGKIKMRQMSWQTAAVFFFDSCLPSHELCLMNATHPSESVKHYRFAYLHQLVILRPSEFLWFLSKEQD
jgi:hypothetical protein